MKKSIVLIFVISILFFLVYCTKKHPCDYDFPDNVNNSSIRVNFKDKKSKTLLFRDPSNFSPYNIDTIKIFNPLGERLHLINTRDVEKDSATGNLQFFWYINFGSLFDYRTDSVAFTRPFCKNFIVYYDYKNRDTLTTCFKAIATPCGSTFEFLKVYYKGNIIDSVFNTTYMQLTHLKY